MKEEKMKVLDLLEQGKITAEDAVKLLETLSVKGNSHFHDNAQEFSKDFEKKMAKLSENLESFTKDLGSKFNSVAKDVEPRVRSISKTVVEKTAQAIDEIAKAINSSTTTDCCCEQDKPQESCCEQEKPEESCCCQQATPADEQPVDNDGKPIA